MREMAFRWLIEFTPAAVIVPTDLWPVGVDAAATIYLKVFAGTPHQQVPAASIAEYLDMLVGDLPQGVLEIRL